MKFLFESWRHYLGEAQLQRADWSKPSALPPEAAQVYRTAMDKYFKPHMAQEKVLRKAFIKATIGAAKGTHSQEEYEKAANDHWEYSNKIGPIFVKMGELFREAGFVPPESVVKGSNEYQQGVIDSDARIAQAAAKGAPAEKILKFMRDTQKGPQE
jgi:hypothetical protein